MVVDVLIRRAETQDVDDLAALYVEFHNFHAAGVPDYLRPVGPPDQKLRDAVGEILANTKAAVFVACLGAEMIGFVEIYIRESADDPAVVPRQYAHLQSLMVTAERRRSGLGARLVEVAHAWAKEQGASEVELDIWEFAAGPLGFYEALGYQTVRRQLVWRR